MKDEVIFVITRQDVINEARELGVPEEKITDEALERIRKGVVSGLECWSGVVKTAIADTLLV